MSREDVLEEKLTQTLWEEERRFFLKAHILPQNGKTPVLDKSHPVLRGLTPSILDSHRNVGSPPRSCKSREEG